MCCSFNFQGRNVRPSDETLVIAAGRQGVQMRFGFRLADGRLVINARSETALEKTLFRESLLCRRIAIPADCFHEWDRDKVKYTFTRPDGRQMYLAGICGKSCFVILTTAANRSMAPVHDRMPLILEDINAWMEEGDGFIPMLNMRPVELARMAGIRQGSLL